MHPWHLAPPARSKASSSARRRRRPARCGPCSTGPMPRSARSRANGRSEDGAVTFARFLLAPGVLLGLAAAGPAAAATPGGAPVSVETAKALMLSGRSEEARSVLQDLAREQPSSNDVAFLLGLLAVDATDYRQAIGYFRSILVREPAALRVRLELGRAFYLSHDYENAFRQFQFARA